MNKNSQLGMRKIILKAIKKLIRLTRLKSSKKKSQSTSQEKINLDKILEILDKEFSNQASPKEKTGHFKEAENYKFGSDGTENEELKTESSEKETEAMNLHDQVVIINTYLVDKFDNSIKYLVEEFQIEMRSIPESVNGFEYLCHPSLEGEENLQKYFDNWLKCILKSLYSLMIVLPIYYKYVSPLSSKEKETASSLKARFKIKVEVKRQDLQKNPKYNQTPKDLEVAFKARHFIGKLLVKFKYSYLMKFKKIWEDVREMQKSLLQDFNKGRRGRFLSEEISDLDSFQAEKRNERLGSYLLGTVSPNQSYNMSDLSTSFKKTTRPFRVQESILEDRLGSLKLSQRSSVESLSKKYRKGSDDRFEEEYEFVMNEENFGDSPSPRKKKRKNKSGDTFKVELTPATHRRRDSQGLAKIGSKLLEIGNILDSDLGYDEDDKIMRFSNEIDRFKEFFYQKMQSSDICKKIDNEEEEEIIFESRIEKSKHKKNQLIYFFDLFEICNTRLIDSQKSKNLGYDQFSMFANRVETDLDSKRKELGIPDENAEKSD